MQITTFKVRLLIFLIVVVFSVLAVIKISDWQKNNPQVQRIISSTKIITTSPIIMKKNNTSTPVKAISSTTTITTITAITTEPEKNSSAILYQGENFLLSYPNGWAETSSLPNYLLVSSKTESTNLTVKNNEEINNFPGYEKKSEEDILVLGNILKLEYWEPLVLDDDFGSGSVNNLAILNLNKDANKALLIYSYQKSATDNEKINEFKTIIDSFKFN
ncbi:hypothetical protein COY43_01015 [Candidatus Berkelbacteria bacterium CG_4_10_14_0_8_um_filter_35_9_33_8]|uniref:PsbP C-terminal domain-containing protein n=1 Tax=Candidatus Berkelbacteria bacterium CG_4_10_14_0_2_um_filter_35_9_33_12 TaxID=1974499 RepID=A0A2M7W3S4_9BACT|nr:MAG: hypothetical protein COX10_00210 [Candidatus Berkelbacteria bacterium CG23_combo_of_CG06-09_8_20_14_all_33_15]PIS08292.1 MAG: hypothetical protein COT76_02320 [Candidatus Berkelbacteria bacterium CG10_big_fil_rev_8_21_14_0_10_33_10]PIZ28328.1 MAG: hypothetical protein COY43_01015 [Candidatus Berkelbacteria bacterium CG_4_10_14_0_8_um_filter_35_9_33_8]PJA20234.1 MAG: hypothetical protein COX60_02400 [Candidatus Berkelbacteria bacterium CG_4_10_14_0_2_um_filter_35_9_33_12]